MASKKFIIEDLYVKGSKDDTVCECIVGGKTCYFTVGAVSRAMDKYAVPGRDSHLVRYNNALKIYSLWQRGILEVLGSLSLGLIYCELPKSVNPDLSFAAKKEGSDWTVYFSKDPTPVEKSYALSIVGAAVLELFDDRVKNFDGSDRDNTPAFFCDAILHGFAKKNTVNGEVVGPDAVDEMLALHASDLTNITVGGGSSDSPFEETEDATPDAYWTWESYLAGEHRLEYDWPERSKALIPPLSVLEEFVPTDTFMQMARVVEFQLKQSMERLEAGLTGAEAIKDCAVNIKLSGPPGAGKSFAVKCLAACLGMPFSLTSVNPKSHSGMVEGTTRMVGSEPTYVEAPLTIAQADGGCHAIEEPNTGDAEMVFSTLSQVVESPYILYRNGIEQVERHPLTVYFILYNKNCGSATMHPALLNRFNQPFRFEAPEKEDFIKMLMAHNPKANYGKGRTVKKVCSWVYKAYNCVINALDSSSGRDAAEAISLRSCFGTLKAIEAGEEPMSALRCLTDNIGDFDAELEEAVKKALRDMMKPI